jgi:hypothetical protein
MRNYQYGSDLRPEPEDDEPELQWLEDSINYLVGTTFALIGAVLYTILFCFLGFFRTSKKTKCD